MMLWVPPQEHKVLTLWTSLLYRFMAFGSGTLSDMGNRDSAISGLRTAAFVPTSQVPSTYNYP